MKSPTHRALLASWLIGAAALLLGCTQAQEAKPVVRTVQTQVVAAASLPDGSVYSGEVRARHEADLGFRVPGKIAARLVDVGAIVRRGQVLARLDPADSQMGADAARAAVSAARTDHQFARTEFERYRSLAEKNFVSRTALDQRQATLDATKARLEQAEAQQAISHNQLGYTSLMADQDGVITAVMGEAGQVVAAGQAVVRLARQGEKEVLISIPETRLAATRSTQEVLVRLWADPARTYKGRLRELSPIADAGTRTFAARISVPGAGPEVALGMTANVLFPGEAKAGTRETILLPLTALYRPAGQSVQGGQADKPSVWVVDPKTGQVALKPVTVAQYRENGAEISAGLSLGETVVTAGVNKLVAGQVVRPLTPQPPAPAQNVAAPR
jgi:multidrug efflux system membrane fusion protein